MSYDCLAIGGRYRHADGGVYTVTSDAKMKLPDGTWIDAVCYVSAHGELFVRGRDSFLERFTYIKRGDPLDQ